MKTKLKKIISIIMIAAVIASVCVAGTVSSSASGTGAGLAEWALKAYYEKWDYVWGGSSPGGVDCSGLIYSYAGGYRVGDAQTFNSDWRYSLGSSIPNIHGLGLYQPGHVGVYVGNGMAVDARGDDYGVCYESVWSHGWTQYFKVPGVSYPDTGWVKFDGDYYYYENGEYLADTSRTIDGETYYFASSGKSSTTPSNTSSTASSSSSSAKKDNGPLKKGSSGSKVEKLQQRLFELGYYTGSVDGDFGENTEKAFKLFQQTAGLYVDGIAGSDADYLYSDDAPAYKKEQKSEETEKLENVEKKKTELAETGAEEETAETAVDAEVTEAAPLSYSLGDNNEDIQKIQERLIALGYMSGEADGDYGDMTQTAVKAFQTMNGLEATGTIEQDTYDALFADSAVKAKKIDTEMLVTSNTPKSVDQNSPAIANAANTGSAAADAPAKTVSAPNTQVEKANTEHPAKKAAAAAGSTLFKRDANGTNFEFILWLAIMVVVMMITFAIVYVIEKKKQRANYGRRYQ